MLFLLLQNDNSVEWDTDKLGEDYHLVFQSDANLVIYNQENETMWATDRLGTPGKVVMQDDGNLVVFDAENNPLWESQDDCNMNKRCL